VTAGVISDGDQQAQLMVCVLAGPWKTKRPRVQSLSGTVIVISVDWPGASTPLAGLKVTAPGTVVEVDQRRDPLLPDRASTLAAQL
jgi:hypothetical protein